MASQSEEYRARRTTRKGALLKSTIPTSNDNSKKSPMSGFGWLNWPPPRLVEAKSQSAAARNRSRALVYYFTDHGCKTAAEIVLIRKKAEYLGRANARTADEAIKVAIKEFEITAAERQIGAIVAWSPYQHWEAISVMLVPVLRTIICSPTLLAAFMIVAVTTNGRAAGAGIDDDRIGASADRGVDP